MNCRTSPLSYRERQPSITEPRSALLTAPRHDVKVAEVDRTYRTKGFSGKFVGVSTQGRGMIRLHIARKERAPALVKRCVLVANALAKAVTDAI